MSCGKLISFGNSSGMKSGLLGGACTFVALGDWLVNFALLQFFAATLGICRVTSPILLVTALCGEEASPGLGVEALWLGSRKHVVSASCVPSLGISSAFWCASCAV